MFEALRERENEWERRAREIEENSEEKREKKRGEKERERKSVREKEWERERMREKEWERERVRERKIKRMSEREREKEWEENKPVKKRNCFLQNFYFWLFTILSLDIIKIVISWYIVTQHYVIIQNPTSFRSKIIRKI